MNAKTITSTDGITATVLRSETDSTNDGISSRTRRIILIGEYQDLPEDPLFPVFRVKTRGDYVYAEPASEVPEGHTGWSMGGNFLYTSDSRFREEINAYPIAIHDRSETWEDYRILSR